MNDDRAAAGAPPPPETAPAEQTSSGATVPVVPPDATDQSSGALLRAAAAAHAARLRSSADWLLHRSGMHWLTSTFRFTPSASARAVGFQRRQGLRWRLSLFLIVATLVPVIAVAAVSIALVLSSAEQGIEFEAQRALQVARALLLQEVRDRANAAARLGEDGLLLEALAHTPADVRRRLAELSEQQPAALVEVTDPVGRVLARCAAGTCNDASIAERFAAFEPADRSPVVRRALEFERSISIEPAGSRLVLRVALPLADGALRLLGAAVMSVSLDGPVADRVKAELGAAREVIFYRGVTPSASTFMAATGERLLGPPLPQVAARSLYDTASPVVALEIGGRSYSVAFGPIQDAAGRRVGILGVALDRETLAAARRRVTLTLSLGAIAVLLAAIGLADVLARRLTRPLRDLHAAALSIALGNLDTKIAVNSRDELGDVAEAFRVMIQSLKENQEGLAARVRELVTVHQVGRAISSVVDLDQVLRSVVGEALSVLGGKTAAIALALEGPEVTAVTAASAAKGKPQRKFTIRAVAGEPVGRRLAEMAQLIALGGRPHRAAAVEADRELSAAAAAAGLKGPLLAAPLTLKDRLAGVILVGRLGEGAFSDADLRLLVTLADQTATAIENARLYTEVRAFSENLEMKVRERTAELERAKAETERALRDLRTAQTQLIHSERMAGLGQLVAGIAHEVNSPAAAVQGSVDALEETVKRLEGGGREVHQLGLDPQALHRYFTLVARLLPGFASMAMPSAVETRALGRRVRAAFAGVPGGDLGAAALAELGPAGEELVGELKELAGGKNIAPLCGYLRELAFLMRASMTIRTAIQSIRRIVGALKRYSRLDEIPIERVDVHAGIEDTLVILAHQLKSSDIGINVKRAYGKIPYISAYVGELNQVWTNLIHNAVQAMGGEGEILIDTAVDGEDVRIAIQDDGPGIPADSMSRIFEPFFTTKGKGEGTGLGLSIAHKIVEKHGGRIRVESVPGRTRFEVHLPIQGPAASIPVARSRAESSSPFRTTGSASASDLGREGQD
ncbi:MAG: ATP-binding protein [Polyangia bacterium]